MSYAGVTLGLIHGSQPDAVVLCHDAGRSMLLGLEDTFHVPPISDIIDTVLGAARVTNPACRCVGISVNTARMSNQQRTEYLGELERQSGAGSRSSVPCDLPCTDPVAMGTKIIADRLVEIEK